MQCSDKIKLFSDSGSYRNQGLVNATILAFFMTSCQPFSCVPTCADQYISSTSTHVLRLDRTAAGIGQYT